MTAGAGGTHGDAPPSVAGRAGGRRRRRARRAARDRRRSQLRQRRRAHDRGTPARPRRLTRDLRAHRPVDRLVARLRRDDAPIGGARAHVQAVERGSGPAHAGRARRRRRVDGARLLLRRASRRSISPTSSVPCLVGGSVDTTPWDYESGARLAAILDAPLVSFEDAGHTVHRTHPWEFAGFARRAVALSARRCSGAVPGARGPTSGDAAEPCPEGGTAERNRPSS